MEQAPPLRRIENEEPSLDKLRPMANAEFCHLDPSVRYLWFLGRGIFWIIVFSITLAYVIYRISFGSGLEVSFYLYAIFGIFVAFLHLLWPFISYKYWGFALRETDLLIRSGVFWKRVSVVPFSRIQHVDSDAGPIERSFGLANLMIHTAGAHISSLGIPGLQAAYAEELRDYLSEVGHTHANI